MLTAIITFFKGIGGKLLIGGLVLTVLGFLYYDHNRLVRRAALLEQANKQLELNVKAKEAELKFIVDERDRANAKVAEVDADVTKYREQLRSILESLEGGNNSSSEFLKKYFEKLP